MSRIWPAEPLLENRLDEPFMVQAPPVSADPQPLAMVRAKVSVAMVPDAGGAVMLTCLLVALVAPELSVTVRVTV